MDIKRAKQEIEHAVKAYLAVDDTGTPLIPPIRQRPILLMGPPGVGKTQIMEQIAAENTVFCLLTRSTVYPKHWLPPCCNFCSAKPLATRLCPPAG